MCQCIRSWHIFQQSTIHTASTYMSTNFDGEHRLLIQSSVDFRLQSAADISTATRRQESFQDADASLKYQGHVSVSLMPTGPKNIGGLNEMVNASLDKSCTEIIHFIACLFVVIALNRSKGKDIDLRMSLIARRQVMAQESTRMLTLIKLDKNSVACIPTIGDFACKAIFQMRSIPQSGATTTIGCGPSSSLI